MEISKTDSLGNIFLHISENDFLAEIEKDPEKIKAICSKRGFAADGLIVFKEQEKQIEFLIFNADGSEAEISGNGLAGLSSLLSYRTNRNIFSFLTKAGEKRVQVERKSDNEFICKVEIGTPDYFNRNFFPFLQPQKQRYNFFKLPFYPVATGNPHIVFILEQELNENEKEEIYNQVQDATNLFPGRTNVEFLKIDNRHLRGWFYERGAGKTLASSTGSAAILAILKNVFNLNQVEIETETGTKISACLENEKIFVFTRTKLIFQAKKLSFFF